MAGRAREGEGELLVTTADTAGKCRGLGSTPNLTERRREQKEA